MYRQHSSGTDAGDGIGASYSRTFRDPALCGLFRIHGPEIPTGAVVFTKEGEFSPKKGDIITFHNGDTVVTHRVVKKEKDIFITKGDANKTEDPVPAEASQIIGRVVFHLPYLGYVIHFLKARIPFAAVCIAACLSVLFDLAYTPKKKKIQGGI